MTLVSFLGFIGALLPLLAVVGLSVPIPRHTLRRVPAGFSLLSLMRFLVLIKIY
jgi:hypothetical protein